MKRICMALLLFVLLTQALPAAAEQSSLKVHDIQVNAGETVYIAVELTKPVTGDSVGISYSYDKAVLKPLPGSSRWEKAGVLQHFSYNNAGVWTVTQPTELKGRLCVLAFRVLTDSYFPQTQVVCKVVIKNGGKEVGVYEGAGRVSYKCDHSYGDAWEDAGSIGHKKTCKHCGGEQIQTHEWIRSNTAANKEDPSLQVTEYICAVCKAKQYSSENSGAALPEQPGATLPTAGGGTQQPDDGHDHDHGEEPEPGDWWVLVLVLGVIALLAAGAVWTLRKKSKEGNSRAAGSSRSGS